jgi:hypothetical protein
MNIPCLPCMKTTINRLLGMVLDPLHCASHEQQIPGAAAPVANTCQDWTSAELKLSCVPFARLNHCLWLEALSGLRSLARLNTKLEQLSCACLRSGWVLLSIIMVVRRCGRLRQWAAICRC